MDLRAFYRRIRQLESEIAGSHAAIVSNETPDGGVAGQISEVAKEVAARMIVEGKARLATAAEAAEHRAGLERGMEVIRRAEALSRIPARLLTDGDIDAIRSAVKPVKGS